MHTAAEKSISKASAGATIQRPRRILALLFLLSVVTYLDRVNISIATPSLEREFGLDRLHMGVIFSAFVLGYMLFQIPGGWIGDRLGHKNTLVGALIWWSVFTGVTTLTGTALPTRSLGLIGSLWVMRFLVGLGEASAYPCANGIIGDWFGNDERALASGVMFAGIGVGSAVTPPFIAWSMIHFGWRSAFHVSAAIGVILASALYFGIPLRQSDSSTAESREAPERPKTPWAEMLRSSQLWALVISIFFFGYVTYVYFFWFYPYLVDIRKISLLRSSLFTAMPFVAMAISAPLGGKLSDRLVLKIGKSAARRKVAMTGLVAAAIFIPSGATIPNPYLAIACLSLGAGSVYLAISAYFASALDIFPAHSATVSGAMNTGAGMGGVVAPILTPYVANHFGWVMALSLAGLFSFVAAILWRFIGLPENRPLAEGNQDI